MCRYFRKHEVYRYAAVRILVCNTLLHTSLFRRIPAPELAGNSLVEIFGAHINILHEPTLNHDNIIIGGWPT